VIAAHRREDLPRTPGPVVAVVGRSNVGKSSLLNRLLGRGAARVGKTPGKTRGIYFYETEDGFRFADFPGAGFARVSREERERWRELADALLRSGAVTLALRLVDPRVPEAAADREIFEYLGALGVPSLAVATKWDRLGARERTAVRRRLEGEHGAVRTVSSKSGEGIEELRREIRRRVKGVEE
jgi:GTP-binding protein